MREEAAAEALARLLRRLSSLRHDNIVRHVHLFHDTSSVYLVTERLQACTLLEHLAVAPVWRESSGRQLMRQLLLGLQYVHEMGVIHRDVRVETVLVVPDRPSMSGAQGERVKLADFAASAAEPALAKGHIGTWGYMAPEMFGKDLYSSAVDIFAAGVVLHILFTGRPPFAPPADPRFIQGHILALWLGHDQRRPPMPRVSPVGRGLLQRMLTPKAGCRSSAAEALEHSWCLPKRRSIGREEPELWRGACSELRFLRVMGTWQGGSSAGLSAIDKPLTSIDGTIAEVEEEDDEVAEERVTELDGSGVELVREMRAPSCVAEVWRSAGPLGGA